MWISGSSLVVGRDGAVKDVAGSNLRSTLACLLLLSIAACAGIPCQPASYYAPSAGAPYMAEEVRVGTRGGHSLVGTLTLPRHVTAQVPAVVLISGASAHDRDMTGGGRPPHSKFRPFRQIADDLARRGIATLRMDDRGAGCSGGGPLKDATTLERANDIRAGIAFIRKRKEIDAARVGLLGVSEGGIIGPLIASTDSAIAAVVDIAGPATRGWDYIDHQFRYAMRFEPDKSDAEKAKFVADRMAYIRRLSDQGKLDRFLQFILNYDPLIAARKVSSPALILHGDRDGDVPVHHARLTADAMRAGGNGDVTVKILADHNHVLLADTDGRKNSYERLFRRTHELSPWLIDLIGDWLAARLHASTVGG